MGGPTGIDQSWSFTDPAAAKRAGVQVVSMYLSHDPSKNVTAGKVKSYHAVDIGVLVNWESAAGAPLRGAGQGSSDAASACDQLDALISAVGYPSKNKIVIYFSCDTDINSGQFSVIAAYYQAAKHFCAARGYGVGCYGEADLCHYLSAQGITDAEWQTYAWSAGRLDPSADYYQYLNGQTINGASVDYDRVIHPEQLGAWWPPNNPLNTGPEDAVLNTNDKAWIANHIAQAIAAGLTGNEVGDFTAKNYPNLLAAGRGMKAANNPAKLAAAIAARIPTGPGATQAQIEKAVADAIDGATIEVH